MARSAGGGILRRPSTDGGRRQVGLFRFFGEVVGELKRVTWPTRQETVRLTLLVIAVAVFIGIVLGLLDLAFTRVLNLVMS